VQTHAVSTATAAAQQACRMPHKWLALLVESEMSYDDIS
jgi:hypothetical protein